MWRSSTLACVLALCFTASVAVAAGTTVYRSEGPNGTVHFSDKPPADAANTEVLQIHAPEGGDPAAAQQQLKEMRYSTERMAESRRERELEREVVRLRAQVDALPAKRAPEPEAIQYVPVYLPPVVTPWYPGHRPGVPHYPGVRPPLQHLPHQPPSLQPPAQQLPGILPGRNSQLMRPIVSDR